MEKTQDYIPPLTYAWLTPLYDRIVPVLIPEEALKRRLIQQAHLDSGQRVLDVGAGTATLTIMVKQAHPGADVVGLDGDEYALDIARSKAARQGAAIRLDHDSATRLPYGDCAFDRVFSSLMIHHLSPAGKRKALAEAWRVLRPGGELHILDFGEPHNVLAWLISLLMRHAEQTRDNIRGLLPEMMREAGFMDVEETGRRMSVVGTLSLYKGRKG